MRYAKNLRVTIWSNWASANLACWRIGCSLLWMLSGCALVPPPAQLGEIVNPTADTPLPPACVAARVPRPTQIAAPPKSELVVLADAANIPHDAYPLTNYALRALWLQDLLGWAIQIQRWVDRVVGECGPDAAVVPDG